MNNLNSNTQSDDSANSKVCEIIPDFDSLPLGTLRRYQSYFKVDLDKNIKEKNKLSEAVFKHFNELDINYEKVIDNFFNIEKDTSNELINNTRKSIRHQEKVEKHNINKILENTTNK